MLNRFKIGTRLAFGFGMLIFASVASLVAMFEVQQYGYREATAVRNQVDHRTELLNEMLLAQATAVSAVRSAGLQTDGGVISQEVDKSRRLLEEMLKHEKELAQAGLREQDLKELAQAGQLREQAMSVAQEAIKFALSFDGERAAAILSSKFAPVQDAWAVSLKSLAIRELEYGREQQAEIARRSEAQMRWLLVGSSVALICAIAFGVALNRSVTRPLRLAVSAAQRVAEGDLSVNVTVDGNDEFAQLLQAIASMTAQLATMVNEVRATSESIATASAQISSGNTDLSRRTELQAISLQQTASNLGDLTLTAARNSEHAHNASSLSATTASEATTCGNEVEAFRSKMQNIKDSSRRIVDIIGAIDAVAFQTNILALNAAVESARAGEHGRGFAVVASEVRALAKRSADAATDVRQLVTHSEEKIQEGSSSMERMVTTMSSVAVRMDDVKQLVGNISSASSDQSVQIDSLNGTIRNVEASTQQNAALVEEVAAASVSLEEQTRRLIALVGRFKLASIA